MFGALQLEGCGFESTLKPPRRDPGQVLHSQWLMRFGVKLRLSVRAVVGSASEWEICERRYNKCSNTIQYNTAHCIQLRILEGFKAADVSPLIGKCRHLVGHFKHSSANTT